MRPFLHTRLKQRGRTSSAISPLNRRADTKMAAQMETLDPSTLSDSTVTYNIKSDTLTLPKGVTSLAGLTVVTGGAEMSCGSCMLALSFWKILVGFSCVAVGIWDQVNYHRAGTSHLLGMGIVILAVSFAVVGSVVAHNLLTKRERARTRAHREDGKEVLVEGDRVIKKVTV